MEQNQKQSKSKKGLIGIVSLFIVLTIGVLGIVAYNQFINNPLVQYVKAEKNTFDHLWNYKDKYYGDGLKIDHKVRENAHESTTTLSAELPNEWLEELELGIIGRFISGIHFVIDTKTNYSSDEFSLGLGLQLIQGSKLFHANMYQNKKMTAFSITEDLYDQYFVLENKRFGDFLRKHGEVNIPLEEIPNFISLQENALTSEKLKEIALDYLTIASDRIHDENVTVEKNVNYKDSKYTKLSLTFSENETYKLLEDILVAMKKDERLEQIFGSKDSQNEELDFLINNLDLIKLPDGLTYEVYMKKNSVHYRTLTLNIDDRFDEDMVTVAFHFNTVKKDKNNHLFTVDLVVDPSNGEGQLVVAYNENGTTEKKQYRVKRNLNFAYSDEYVKEGVELEADTTYQGNTSETTFNIVSNFEDIELPELKGYLNTSTEDNGKNAKKSFDVGLNIKMIDSSYGKQELDFVFNGKTDYTFTDDIDFPTVNEKNSVNIYDLTENDFQDIVTEIEENAYQYYQSFINGLDFFR